METTAHALLTGPRGRRLCLELAMRLSQDIHSSVFHLGHEHDPGERNLYVTSFLSVGGTEDLGAAHAGEHPDVSLEQLADQLLALRLREPSERLIHQSLTASVDFLSGPAAGRRPRS